MHMAVIRLAGFSRRVSCKEWVVPMLNNNYDKTKIRCHVCNTEHDATYETEGNEVYLHVKCPHGLYRTRVSSDAALFQTFRTKCRPVPPDSKPLNYWHYIHITDTCSLNCPTCFPESGPDKDYKMSLDEVRACAKKICDAHGQSVIVTGGEPTEHPQFLEIVRILSSEFKLQVSVGTNGIRFAEEPDFANDCRKASLFKVELSFDSLRDEVYRVMRGRDLLATKKKALDNLRPSGINVTLDVVLCTANIDELGELARFALANAPFVNSLRIQPLQAAGRYVPELMGLDRERAVHAIVESNVIPGLTLDDFIPDITCPMIGMCIHPDCSALLYLATCKGKAPKILTQDRRFDKLLDDLTALPPGKPSFWNLRIQWAIYRRTGLKGLRAFRNADTNSSNPAIFVLVFDNLMPADQHDTTRHEHCGACVCFCKDKTKTLCSYSVEGPN